MTRPIWDTEFWRERLSRAGGDNLHHAVYLCTRSQWDKISEAHRKILAANVGDTDWVLDCGCGYGHLLELMPPRWRGIYTGVDLSPDMIARAQQRHHGNPRATFAVRNLTDLRPAEDGVYDWAVLKSIRPMVTREMGADAWAPMEAEIRRVAKRLLYLEYDPDDPGSIE